MARFGYDMVQGASHASRLTIAGNAYVDEEEANWEAYCEHSFRYVLNIPPDDFIRLIHGDPTFQHCY